MNLLQPFIWYLICTVTLCIFYFGLEYSDKKLGFTAKATLSIWPIVSLIITCGLFSIQKITESGNVPPPQISLVTFGASIITLCISSGCVYSAK